MNIGCSREDLRNLKYPTAAGYYPSPWPGEDGGAGRLQAVAGLPGLAIQPGESLRVEASRRLSTGNMVVLREPGEVYLMHVDTLRDKLGMRCYSHIEKLDPETLKPVKKSSRLPGGSWWPGGFCVHRNGDLYLTFGRWAHRLNPDCELVASYKLPQDLPYNSHVILDNGFIVTKPIASEGSTSIVILDPDTLREGENSVVLDIETGEEKARIAMGNYMQSAVFPCPGWGRDIYWLGLDRLTRLAVK